MLLNVEARREPVESGGQTQEKQRPQQGLCGYRKRQWVRGSEPLENPKETALGFVPGRRKWPEAPTLSTSPGTQRARSAVAFLQLPQSLWDPRTCWLKGFPFHALHCTVQKGGTSEKKKKSPLHIETTNPRAAGPWDICMGSFCLPPILPNREVFSSVPLGVFTPVVVHIMRTYPSVFPLEQGHCVLNLSRENIRTFWFFTYLKF